MSSGPAVQEVKPPPAPVDNTAAMLAGLRYAETQRRIRESRGRRAAFLTADSPSQLGESYGRPNSSVTKLGQ